MAAPVSGISEHDGTHGSAPSAFFFTINPLRERPYPGPDEQHRLVKISGQLPIQPLDKLDTRHETLDPILKYEMKKYPQPVLDYVPPEEFDIIFGEHAFHGRDSLPLAQEVLQYLKDNDMVRTDERDLCHWDRMFPRCTTQSTYGRLPMPSEYIPGPNLHAAEPPKDHEENVATLIETIARIAHSLEHTHLQVPSPQSRRVRSYHDRLIGNRRKPDVVVLQDAADVLDRGVRVDWHHVACVGEIKYSAKDHLKREALWALVDASWFALQSTFGRRYVVTFALCGHVLVMCMVDHGGRVTTTEVDMEKHPLHWIQCIIAVTMGPDEMLGDDKSIKAFTKDVPSTDDLPVDDPPTNSGHTMRFHDRDYRLDARLFLNPSALGRATSIYAATQMKTKGDPTHHAQIAIKDFWPTPEGPFEAEYLNYIHRLLQEKRLEGISDLPPSTAFPLPVVDELVMCTDPRSGEEVVESTQLRRRVQAVNEVNYENRVHYRIAFEQVVVDLTWFATRQEYFEAILAALEAHRFAADHCQVLHGDINPNNIFIIIDRAAPEQAIPDIIVHNYTNSRKYQLGDWGLCMPLRNFDVKNFDFKADRVPIDEWRRRVGGHSGVTALKDPESNNRKIHGQPNMAFNRTGTIATMATPLLADPHGQRVPRLVQHDLESFFWTTLFGLVNFTGPFQQVKDWSTVEEGSTSSAEEFVTTGAPPVWMRLGVAEYKFHDVHMSRLSTLGNWQYYKGFIQPYWWDEAILSGMEKMFNIFMSQDMFNTQGHRCGMATNISFNQDLRHDKLIAIVKEIIQGLKDPASNDIMHMLLKGIPAHNVTTDGRARYKSLLESHQLPPAVPSDDLKNKPVVATTRTMNKRRLTGIVREVAAEFASALYSSTPPVLQDGQSSYSALHGAAHLYSSADPDNRAWQEMSDKTFERLSNIKIAKPAGFFPSAPHTEGSYHTFSASESGGHALTTPAVGVASAGGVSSSSSKRSSADWRQAEDEDEAMLPTRKRHKGKEKVVPGSCMGESDGDDDRNSPSALAPRRGRRISPKAGSSR